MPFFKGSWGRTPLARKPGPAGLGILAAMASLFAVVLVDNEQTAHFREQSRTHVQAQLGRMRADLESTLNARLHLVRGLAAFAKTQRTVDEAVFQKFAAALQGNQAGIRSLQLAPKGVVTHVYPLQGNEAARGHDLLADPARRDAAMRAITNREFVIAGPLRLRQGGVALVGRLPIFASPQDGGGGEELFWGFSVILVDLEPLLREGGVIGGSGNLQVALRGKDGLGADGEVFHGEASVFDRSPVLLSVLLPHGSWQLAAIPAAGWSDRYPGRAWLWAAGALLSITIGVLTFFLIRRDEIIRSTSRRLAESQRIAKLGNWDWNIVTDELWWSDEIYRIFGAERKSFGATYEAFLERVHPDDRDLVTQGVDRALHEHEAYDIDHRIVLADGTEKTVHEEAEVVFDEKGRAVRMIGTVHDITERKQVERALRRSNAELEQFAYVASHDMRDPLTVIVGFSELLAMQCKAKMDTESDEYLSHITSSAKRLLGMTTELLELAKITQSNQHVDETDFNTVIELAERNLRKRIHDTHATINHDPLPVVLADEKQMISLFQNLIANAIKYRKEDTSPQIHIGALREEGLVTFSVQDNGVGIAPEHLEKIFMVFNRVPSQSSDEGWGIGLAVCRRIVERHNGHIWVESEPGVGSTFYVQIPQ